MGELAEISINEFALVFRLDEDPCALMNARIHPVGVDGVLSCRE